MSALSAVATDVRSVPTYRSHLVHFDTLDFTVLALDFTFDIFSEIEVPVALSFPINARQPTTLPLPKTTHSSGLNMLLTRTKLVGFPAPILFLMTISFADPYRVRITHWTGAEGLEDD